MVERALLRTLVEFATGNSNECPKAAANAAESVPYNQIGNPFTALLLNGRIEGKKG